MPPWHTQIPRVRRHVLHIGLCIYPWIYVTTKCMIREMRIQFLQLVLTSVDHYTKVPCTLWRPGILRRKGLLLQFPTHVHTEPFCTDCMETSIQADVKEFLGAFTHAYTALSIHFQCAAGRYCVRAFLFCTCFSLSSGCFSISLLNQRYSKEILK